MLRPQPNGCLAGVGAGLHILAFANSERAGESKLNLFADAPSRTTGTLLLDLKHEYY